MATVTRNGRRADGPPGLTIVHDIPGRVRLRLPSRARTIGVAEAVDALTGVEGCTWSPRTRSLLIRYDAGVLTLEQIVRAVAQHVGLPAPDDLSRVASSAEGTTAAVAVTDAFGQLNRRIGHLTRGRLDLAILVPLALALWAMRQILRGQLTPLTWSAALWYAHGLFRDYNNPPIVTQ